MSLIAMNLSFDGEVLGGGRRAKDFFPSFPAAGSEAPGSSPGAAPGSSPGALPEAPEPSPLVTPWPWSHWKAVLISFLPSSLTGSYLMGGSCLPSGFAASFSSFSSSEAAFPSFPFAFAFAFALGAPFLIAARPFPTFCLNLGLSCWLFLLLQGFIA